MLARLIGAIAGLLGVSFLGLPPCAAGGGWGATPERIRAQLGARLSPEELARLVIPFEADPAIVEQAVRITRDARTPAQRLERLKGHFHRQGYLARYDRDGTRSAREVMETGEGNCLSYANLFVAMARAVGLQAIFLDASRTASESGKSGSLLVEYGHVLVGVRLGPELVAIEFDGRARTAHRYEPLSDLQAIADFYNNLGFERTWSQGEQAGPLTALAVEDFRLATRIAPDFSRAWNNLGVALTRLERLPEAEQAYRQAIRTDPESAPAYANLGQLLLRQASPLPALEALGRAVALAPGNAHYRLFLARALLGQGRDEEARTQLEQAARLESRWFLPHLELMLLRERRGELEAARDAAREVLLRSPGQRDALRVLGG